MSKFVELYVLDGSVPRSIIINLDHIVKINTNNPSITLSTNEEITLLGEADKVVSFLIRNSGASLQKFG